LPSTPGAVTTSWLFWTTWYGSSTAFGGSLTPVTVIVTVAVSVPPWPSETV
jgi:hypothetical protein